MPRMLKQPSVEGVSHRKRTWALSVELGYAVFLGREGVGLTVASSACTPLMSWLQKSTPAMFRKPAQKNESAWVWLAVRTATDSSLGSLMHPSARIM